MKSGLSANLLPRKLVLRHKLDFKKHCKALFGSYCEARDEPDRTNTMAARSIPAIVLGPMGNLQETYKFLNLTTGKKVKRGLFTAYPIPDLIVKKVEGMGHLAVPGALNFANRNGILFKWNDDVDENPEGIVKEDTIPYPSLVA
jgi:hypothetical protein